MNQYLGDPTVVLLIEQVCETAFEHKKQVSSLEKYAIHAAKLTN